MSVWKTTDGGASFVTVYRGYQESALSMALVRLVNGVSGALQKGVYAKSVASLAESVGLPRALVDLRHEATHNALPTMSALGIAADQALSWLRENYWSLQGQELRNQRKLIAEVSTRTFLPRSLSYILTPRPTFLLFVLC